MFKTKTRRIKLTGSVFGPRLHLSASIFLNCRFYRSATTVVFHNAQSSKALYITFCVGPAHSFQPGRHDAFTCIHITHNKQKQTHMSPTSWGPPEVEAELSQAGRGQLGLVSTGDTVRSLSGGTPYGLFRSEYLLVSLMSASCDFLLTLHHKTKVLSSRLWK